MKYLFLFFCVIFNHLCFAQGPGLQWAGPDTLTCGELGVTIGLQNSSCAGCCFKWEPAIGLSCTNCPRPVAKPHSATTYKVTVVSQNLSWVETDEVRVGLSFGNITFTPAHLAQGTQEMSTATLVNSNTSNISWGFDGDGLGCQISGTGTSAQITPGLHYGTVKVKATNNDVPGCVFNESIEINNGVKDVWAVDLQHPERIAKNGQTLHVINHGDVQVRAIPNEGGFAPGKPDWKNDLLGSTTPPDGSAVNIMTQTPLPFPGSTSQYIAGDSPEFSPKVDVVRELAATITTPIGNLPGLQDLINILKEKIKFNGGNKTGNLPSGPVAPATLDISITNIDFKQKHTKVEKYNDPGTGTKNEFSAEMGVSITGKIYHPVFSKYIYVPVINIGLISELFVGATAGISLAFNTSKDPSIENNNWKLDNITGEAAFGIIAGLEITGVAAGYQALISFTASSTVKPSIFFDPPSSSLKTKTVIEPLRGTVIAKIIDVSNPAMQRDVFEFPSLVLDFIPVIETDPVIFHSFN